jgi:putative transposase
VPGLAIFALSLVNVDERQSYPLMVEQRVRSTEEKQAAKTKRKAQKATKPKGKPGRPKGCKQKDKTVVEWTPELLFIQSMLLRLVAQLAKLPVKYVVMDGHFGNNNALQMVRQATPWHLISKLRHDAALYFLYDGEQKPVGRHRWYRNKVNYRALPGKYLVKTAKEAQILTQTYQAIMLHKSFAQTLNVVIVVKRNLVTNACAHVVLFSSDLALTHDKLVDYYVLRFQLEFNFKDDGEHLQDVGEGEDGDFAQVNLGEWVGVAFWPVSVVHVQADDGVLEPCSLFFGEIIDLKVEIHQNLRLDTPAFRHGVVYVGRSHGLSLFPWWVNYARHIRARCYRRQTRR